MIRFKVLTHNSLCWNCKQEIAVCTIEIFPKNSNNNISAILHYCIRCKKKIIENLKKKNVKYKIIEDVWYVS